MHPVFTPVILIHTFAALAALALGSLVFLRRKGNDTHRWMGRAWAALMVLTAVSTYWIRGNGGFSWIHGLSIVTLLALAHGLHLVMTGDIRRHRFVMGGLYFGALIVAGLFTLLPQRLLGRMLWSSLGVI